MGSGVPDLRVMESPDSLCLPLDLQQVPREQRGWILTPCRDPGPCSGARRVDQA